MLWKTGAIGVSANGAGQEEQEGQEGPAGLDVGVLPRRRVGAVRVGLVVEALGPDLDAFKRIVILHLIPANTDTTQQHGAHQTQRQASSGQRPRYLANLTCLHGHARLPAMP